VTSSARRGLAGLAGFFLPCLCSKRSRAALPAPAPAHRKQALVDQGPRAPGAAVVIVRVTAQGCFEFHRRGRPVCPHSRRVAESTTANASSTRITCPGNHARASSSPNARRAPTSSRRAATWTATIFAKAGEPPPRAQPDYFFGAPPPAARRFPALFLRRWLSSAASRPNGRSAMRVERLCHRSVRGRSTVRARSPSIPRPCGRLLGATTSRPRDAR